VKSSKYPNRLRPKENRKSTIVSETYNESGAPESRTTPNELELGQSLAQAKDRKPRTGNPRLNIFITKSG